MEPVIEQILEAKREAGPEACLWVTTLAGDAILYAGENDDHILARWQLTRAQEDALLATGEVDEVG